MKKKTPGMILGASFLKRDSRGLYYTTDTDKPDEIFVFGPTGRFRATIGREGAGPGEYRAVQAIHIGDGDTLHVFDVGNRRHTVLSPSYEVVETHPYPGNLVTDGCVFFDDGTVVLNAVLATPEGIGFPFHVVDSAGSLVRSFGSDDETVTPRTLYSKAIRRMTRAEGDLFWVAHRRQ